MVHDGHSKDVALKVGQLPGEQTTSNAMDNGGAYEQLGLALAPLSPEMRNQLDVPGGTSRAVVHRYGRDRPRNKRVCRRVTRLSALARIRLICRPMPHAKSAGHGALPTSIAIP